MKTYLYQINVTRDCNLRCTHCYIHSDIKASSGQMQITQVLDIAKGIRQHMQQIGYEHAEIHLIGGEPTMLGLAFFEEAIPAMRGILSDAGFSAEIILVSNLLSPDILGIARQFDRVSTSYEPETRFPKPKLEQMWRENVNLLRAAGIDLGVTTAVTRPVVAYGAAALLQQLYDQGLRQIHLGFFIPEGDGLVHKLAVFPTFAETSQFMIEAAQWAIARRDEPDLFVNPFESLLSAIHNDEPLDDIVCPIIAGSMDINWDGNAATCLEAGGAREPEWLGNVFTEGLSTVAQSVGFQRKVLDATAPQRACRTCPDYAVCRSGCGVLHQFWNPGLDADCPGFRRFIEFVREQHAGGLRPRYDGYTGKSAG